jgi:hypothetical protein
VCARLLTISYLQSLDFFAGLILLLVKDFLSLPLTREVWLLSFEVRGYGCNVASTLDRAGLHFKLFYLQTSHWSLCHPPHYHHHDLPYTSFSRKSISSINWRTEARKNNNYIALAAYVHAQE